MELDSGRNRTLMPMTGRTTLLLMTWTADVSLATVGAVLDPMHFDARADVYDRSRPAYPVALWDRLSELGVLGPDVRVLELGPGTGQATRRLLDTCRSVTAVEPGQQLARRLRERCPEAAVLVASAEEADFDAGAFDLAVAATSVHWLDLDVVLPKVHRALTPGGHFAVWRTAFGDPAVTTPFRERMASITDRRARPAAERPDTHGHDVDYWVGRITEGGLFTLICTDQFRWSIELDSAQIHDLFSTFSDWSTDEVDEAAEIVRDLGGVVTEHYVTPLLVVRAAIPTT